MERCSLQPSDGFHLFYASEDPEHPGEVFATVTINGETHTRKLTKGQRDNLAIALVQAMAKDSK